MLIRVFLIFLCFVLYGCSWNTRFAISNLTDADIEISIASRMYTHVNTGEVICPLINGSRLEVSDDYLWYFNSGDWLVLPKGRQTVDELACSIKFSIKTGESVVIANVATYTGLVGRGDVIDVAQVEIRRQGKLVIYKGVELLNKFQKIDDLLYVMRVTGV